MLGGSPPKTGGLAMVGRLVSAGLSHRFARGSGIGSCEHSARGLEGA